MEDIRSWIEQSPYAQFLGVRLDHLDESSARILLPYKDDNSNPGQALHGGCAASLGGICGQAIAQAALGEGTGPWHTAQMQISYLAAAIGEDIVAEAELLRRGKELCFVNTNVQTADGKPVANITSTIRARMGAAETELTKSNGDQGANDPGPMGPHIGRTPYNGHRGIAVEHMANGWSRLTMPNQNSNGDLSGGVHEGAQLALLDTTGAMAAWGVTGPGRFKASTVSIQVQYLGPPPQSDLVAYGRCVRQDNEIFWIDVEVANTSDGSVSVRGTVLYRIVV